MAVASTVIALQFGIMSPEDIRRGSVVEIDSRDTYINNKPVIKGLFDPRMGTLEPGSSCPTDGLNYIQTPGYFGHIELARPVFYIQFFDTIMEILKVVCIKCSKVLVDKNKYKCWECLPNDKRWRKIHALAGSGKLKRCGENNDDGCGCKQPKKYKKDGVATILAEWPAVSDTEEKVTMKMTPELVLKMFKRISDEDIVFMGFSPVWSRPEWMICQVLAVPPPAVRPSVKHDAQQRSEDDLTHSLIQIIKTNKSLGDKIKHNGNPITIEEEHLVLQFFVATMIDNKLSGAQPAAQRSGRAFKSIKDRLNGKMGRVRGNLMGKRVDFSARSVITPDPNLSIRELGVPFKIALNMTKPVVVNERNLGALQKLVLNGPLKYPGAKIIDRQGAHVSLRYANLQIMAQSLACGDVVHRHIQNGDFVLFNRQPTLHRMSMMGHVVRVMFKGDTFRMNVGDTKPYNADFDGDEMNMHMPQDLEAETELRHLAAVPHQILSPGSNQPIIGIFQDSLLGAYLFSRMPEGKPLAFSPLHAMAMCAHLKKIDPAIFKQGTVSSFDLLTQIFPAMTLKIRNKASEDSSAEGLVSVVAGDYKNGQLGKNVLNTVIHRIFNDYGDYVASDFIDNLQHIITEYMKASAFSVGVSDLLSTAEVNAGIEEAIQLKNAEVDALIKSTMDGTFKNETGRPNVEDFETNVNAILGMANEEAGKVGRSSLKVDNRFVAMVKAGSKGSDINIAQMVSCLGQQQIEGKRIPYGFDDRTLPHFCKYDDSPKARGFISASFIKGLQPEDLFFHAMGGRIGLIDTAVKTSTTGYIQRKLIKGLEDLMLHYDGTVRNSKNRVIEFAYGGDNVDPSKVEDQNFPLASMKIEEIYEHFLPTEEDLKHLDQAAKVRTAQQQPRIDAANKRWIHAMVAYRDEVATCVFGLLDESRVRAPVAFSPLLNSVNQIFERGPVDLTLLEAYEMLDETYARLATLNKFAPTELFKILYYFFLAPRQLLRRQYTKHTAALLLENVVLQYKRALANPGDMVGIIAAQSIGEPTTQLTLNTFHFAGVASKSTVTRGTPRVEEILSLSSNPKTPSMTVFLKDNAKAAKFKPLTEHTTLYDITETVEIYYDGDRVDNALLTRHAEFEDMLQQCGVVFPNEPLSPWIFRLQLDKEALHKKDITPDDVAHAVKREYGASVACIYSDFNADETIFRVQLNAEFAKKKVRKALDDADNMHRLRQFEEEILQITIKGLSNIKKAVLRQIKNGVVKAQGNYVRRDEWVIDTVGTNLKDVLALPWVDTTRTYSNDLKEMFSTFGIEAARRSIRDELTFVLADSYINAHHTSVLCNRMTFKANMTPMFRSGINGDDIGVIAKASFEETPQMFIDAAKHAELDPMRGVSANVMCGQRGYFGTNSFDIVLDQFLMDTLKAPPEKDHAPPEDFKIEHVDIKNPAAHLFKVAPQGEAADAYVVDM